MKNAMKVLSVNEWVPGAFDEIRVVVSVSVGEYSITNAMSLYAR